MDAPQDMNEDTEKPRGFFWYLLWLVFFSLFAGSSALGALGIKECPAQPFIPAYVLGNGINWVLIGIIFGVILDGEIKSKLHFTILLIFCLSTIGLAVSGNYVVISNFGNVSTRKCDKDNPAIYCGKYHIYFFYLLFTNVILLGRIVTVTKLILTKACNVCLTKNSTEDSLA